MCSNLRNKLHDGVKESSHDYCKYYDNTMKRKNENKCYRARVVTLMIVLRNIYQIISPNHTFQTHVNNKSICYIKLLFN